VDARVWHQVGLELGDINIEGTIETQGGGQGRHDLGHDAVQVGVGRALNVEATTADVVEGLVVEHDSDVGVLEESVGGEHSVVRLNDSSGHLRGRVHAECELGLFAVVDGQTLEEKGTETGASTTSNSVEHDEALETSALVGELAQAIEGEVDNLFTHGVMATGVVIGGILLARDQLLWVVELAVGSGADLVDHGRLEIEVDGARDVLASTSLREEGVERVVTATNGLVGGHLAIRLDAVLEAVKLPAAVTNLATSLSAVN